jgi:Ca2+-binding RTX toxin-like protein
VHSARCTAPPTPPLYGPELSIDGVVADLSDRDDALTVAFPGPVRAVRYNDLVAARAGVVVDGGTGADVLDATRAFLSAPIAINGSPRYENRRSGFHVGVELRGGRGRDTLNGGRGNDALEGGADADVLRGGAGSDELSGDGPSREGPRGSDLIDGGAGADVVSYAERLAPVVVDLERGSGGRPGEGDRLRAVEHVDGGRGRDRLLGDGRANRLWGLEPPATSLVGDVLVGRAGRDVLRPFSRRDRLACGAGSDVVLRPRDGAFVPRDCEWMSLDAGAWLTPALAFSDLISPGAVRAGRALFWLHRNSTAGGSVSLSSPRGTVYGRAGWPSYARWHETRRVSFRLNMAGRRAAACHGVAVVRAAWGKDPDDRRKPSVGTWRIRL